MVDCKLIELPSLRGNYNNTFETNLKKSKHKKKLPHFKSEGVLRLSCSLEDTD